MTKRIFIASLFAASFFSAQAEDLYLDGTQTYTTSSGNTDTFDAATISGGSTALYTVGGTSNIGTLTIEKTTGITSNSGFEVLKGGTVNVGTVYSDGGLSNMAGTMTVTDSFCVGGYDNTKFIVKSGGKLYTNGAVLDNLNLGVNYNLRIEGYMKNVGDMVLSSQGTQAGLSISQTGIIDTDTLTLNAGYVDISGTLNVNQISLNPDRTLTQKFYLWPAGVLNINGSNISTLTDLTNTGVVNINAGTTQIAAKDGFKLQGGTINIKSGARLEALYFYDPGNPYTFRVTAANSKINIYGTGIFDLGQTCGGNDMAIDGGAGVTIFSEKSNSIVANKITFFYNTTLTLNSEKTFVGEAGDYNITLNLAQGCVATINVNALSQFGDINLQQGSKLIFNMGSGADSVLVLDAITQYITHVGSIVFNDFNNEKVFFLDMSELPSFATISGTGVNGKTLTNSDFSLIAGEFNGESGYWLYAAGVPEPSTFAAIFGASALALALYRRRRKI